VTTIKFGLPKAAKVTLKVYDILGREVSILFNNVDLNAGIVTYDFDGTDLASGVYFYTLIVNNNKIDTKRMVMLK
ncbi:MAG TPA: T9SS C-terminal target domain-containing protein, partial [Bacteroidetes bacterium]|nr:T9SS C-terminal target domain-containing protein [Bacteroidota bacterium]